MFLSISHSLTWSKQRPFPAVINETHIGFSFFLFWYALAFSTIQCTSTTISHGSLPFLIVIFNIWNLELTHEQFMICSTVSIWLCLWCHNWVPPSPFCNNKFNLISMYSICWCPYIQASFWLLEDKVSNKKKWLQ